MVNSDDLLHRVKKVIAEDVMPGLQMDGARVEVVCIEHGVAQVRLSGTCTSCPSTVRAVLMGVEEELRKRVPEIDYLETVP
jgi:Fe-S cluster biogenesis protein NfuA